jgi:hypothetical protein
MKAINQVRINLNTLEEEICDSLLRFVKDHGYVSGIDINVDIFNTALRSDSYKEDEDLPVVNVRVKIII